MVARGFIGGRYPDCSVFELFEEKICRVVPRRDERGQIGDYVEFYAPHVTVCGRCDQKARRAAEECG